MRVGASELDLRRPVVMAIINVTPDSFFPGSRLLAGDIRLAEDSLATDGEITRAVDKAIADGADILDVGGYSSRPGAADVSPGEEFGRVARALKIIRERHPEAIVSVDTFRACVARRCIDEFGPCVINDISGGGLDSDMHRTAAGYGVPYVAMHMRATPATMQQHTEYDDITEDVKSYFEAKISEMKAAGIRDENIILDPGFGFAKTTSQNYQLMRRMDELTRFGYPLLAGVSRKSMIYKVLDVEPAESLAGTAALNWETLCKGASILRVHDVREAAQVVKLYEYYKNA